MNDDEKDQFIAGYCERSGIDRVQFDSMFVALACACGDDLCSGWAVVTDHPLAIKMHMELYAPERSK